MTRQRTRATELARLLHDASCPVYVLDDQRRLVFCNERCLEWLAWPAEEVIGQACGYHSVIKPGTAEAAVVGLCPPPEVEDGRARSATVAIEDGQGRLRRRQARFVPLASSGGNLVAIVALLDEEDLPEDESPVEPGAAAAEEPRADLLHDRIRRFRHAAAGRYRLDRFAGDSPAMRQARAQAELAAGCRASVSIFGPPGSGRQHLATAIHYASDPRREGSLLPLDCATLGSELIRSTVLALAAHPLPQQAAHGTLLLSEVDRLPEDAQAELAGVLRGRGFALRVIATSRGRLAARARRGRFRPDLAAVLETIPIRLPPLAARREDLPLLAQMFLEDVNARGTKQLGGLTAEALDCLDAYPWPGNVDELAAMIAEAHGRAEGPEIRAADLPRRIHLAAEAAACGAKVEEAIQLDGFLEQIERELIARALRQAKGNKARAARLLGLSRPRLYRRMVQLGLESGST